MKSKFAYFFVVVFTTGALCGPMQAFEADVVIDNDDGSGVELSPTNDWVAETQTANAFRGTGKITSTSTLNASRYARFYTTLPKTGPWQVFIWKNGRSSGAPNEATARITHADINPSDVRFDGGGSTGEWVLAGVYWFETSKQAEVKVIHDDTGILGVDAVRFSFAEVATVVDSSTSSSGVTLSPNSAAWGQVTEKSGHEEFTRRGNTSAATVTFTPTLPVGGKYDVSIWIPQSSGAWLPGGGTMSTTIPVDVTHRGTTESFSVTIPTTGANEGSWVRVGTTPFLFDAGPNSNNKVVVKTPASGSAYVPADAIRFTKVGTFSYFLDNDDPEPNPPTEPSGVVANPNPGNWMVIADDPVTRPWDAHKWIAVGPDAERAGANTTNALEYTAPVSEIGLYDTYIWYPHTNSNATNTVVSVANIPTAGNPTTTNVTVNQQQTTAQWVHVGRYVLNSSNAKLSIKTAGTGSNNTNADGVLFMRDGEEKDTDGDGSPDWRETYDGTNPNVTDTDGDGLTDGQELALGTGGLVADSDSDGIGDGNEHRLGMNPLAAKQTASSASQVGYNIYSPLTPP